MSEWLVLFGVAAASLSGVPGLLCSRDGRGAERLFVALMTVAGVTAGIGAITALAFGGSSELSAAWAVPGGRLSVGVDAISAMFVLLGAAGRGLEMEGWSAALASPLGDAIFVLGLLGFGLKAGIMPLHIWLPGALLHVWSRGLFKPLLFFFSVGAVLQATGTREIDRLGGLYRRMPRTAVAPTVALVGRLLARLRPIQRGSIHLYLLYILGALVALLAWI